MTRITRTRLLACASLLAMTVNTMAPAIAATTAANDGNTTTPIKHVIIIVGENRSFDHVFGTYKPAITGQTVDNLLSKGIVTATGAPGPNVALATQYQARDVNNYQTAPKNKIPYAQLPPILTAGAPTTPAFAPAAGDVSVLSTADYGLETGTEPYASAPVIAGTPDIELITTGGTGLPKDAVDSRIPNAKAPANAPFQISNPAGTATYDSYAASPVHRFYQMFQQLDCSAANASATNTSGCLNDLFPWVEVTVGAGGNGETPAQYAGGTFSNTSTGEGSTSMGFYNVQTGDMPYFKKLADTYALGDNYHQPVKGGTGADSVYLGFASDVWFSDSVTGKPIAPPAGQIENPNPLPTASGGTNNWYANDGYGSSKTGEGGTYTDCSDPTQPAVRTIRTYLNAIGVNPNCQGSRYYLLNNYNPAYSWTFDATTGTNVPVVDTSADLIANNAKAPFDYTIPPVSQRSIANTLDEAQVSWTYYGEGWNWYKAPSTLPSVLAGNQVYCNICNPFLYQSYVMNAPNRVKANLKDTADLYTDLANGVLPAVSWVKPGGLNDGHPSSSKFDIFEAFTKKILDLLASNPTLAADTAVFITVDEGGGYYDSGFVQAVDYFGDGTRIPMIVVSPFSKGVGVVHSYGDHASFIKFVNKNWGLPPITSFTRDNLPNPVQTGANPYVPTNGPAIDDLTTYFNFTSN
jgi:phospholipase C